MKTPTRSILFFTRATLVPRLALLFLLGVGLSPRAEAVSEPSAITGEKRGYALSWEDEIKQGAEADKEITAQMGLYDDPKVQAYVQRVGERVLAASTFNRSSTPEIYRNTQFTFRVLDSPVVNAFALPGGYVYVTRGLLAHADNEAQLAVVLGHEIAHVAARHASLQARRSQWSQIGVIAGAILGQAVLGERMPNFAQNVLEQGGQALQVFLLRYSREAETEADGLGVDYALTAGYAAEESARFFDALRRIRDQEGKGLPSWLSSHPDPGNRANNVIGLARARAAAGQAQRQIGQEEYLRHMEGIIVGEDPRQGFVQNGVFYHPTLHFQMPVAPNWKVENQPTAVVFAEPNGRAMMGLRLASAPRMRDAASQFVTENKVQVTASGDTAVNGLPATVVVGRANTKEGQVGVWNAFIEYQGKVYSILGYAPAQVFEQARPTFEAVAGGFSPLRDTRMVNVTPTRLRVVRTDRAAPFASFIPTALPPNLSAESVAIMNQVGLEQSVPAGAVLKVPDLTPGPHGTPAVVGRGAPAPASYPGQPGTYPPPSYPPAPTQQPRSYPQEGAYPGGQYPGYPSSSDPRQQGYPPAGQATYPSYPPPSYPPQSYPSSGQYPPATPPSGQSYPAYPPQYPPGTPYPQSQPAYPGSSPYPAYPPASTTGTPTGGPAPNWPR